MARRYDILSDFNSDGKNLSVSPYAIIAIWPHKYPTTYKRDLRKSFDDNILKAVELASNDPLIIVDDIINLQVSSIKSNHVGSMSANLRASQNYLSKFNPGDYVSVWIMNDETSFQNMLAAIKKGDGLYNSFDSGLKFFGKVTSIRKSLVQSPDGIRSATYSMNAASFTELDTGIYYEPYLGAEESRLGTGLFRRLGIEINDFLASNEYLSTNLILPTLLNKFFTDGFPKNANLGDQNGQRITAGGDSSGFCIVPQPVASIFTKIQGSKKIEAQDNRTKNAHAYTDILQVIHGIQKYSFYTPTPTEYQNVQKAKLFLPDIKERKGNMFYTGSEQIGTFYASVPQFSGNKSIWSILEEFVNKVTNELYATLRVNQDGRIVPTLISRQHPFSSGLISEHFKVPETDWEREAAEQPIKRRVKKRVKRTSDGGYSSADQSTSVSSYIYETEIEVEVTESPPKRATEYKHIPLTRFAELPRWRLDPVLVYSMDVGRSDSMRFNMVHVYGEGGTANSHTPDSQISQYVRSPPIFDDLDINRNGVRQYSQIVPCSEKDTKDRTPTSWMYIMADIVMGQHMKLTGSVSTVGIQAPICIGDNLEFDGHLFHIEGVTHSFSMNPGGTKSFKTQLSLTYGVRGDESLENDPQLNANNPDQNLFAGYSSEDLTHNDSKQFVDRKDFDKKDE